jgi:galactoside O-acetyltransferase
MNSFLTVEELKSLGLKKYGNNVLIGRYVQLYNPDHLEIGDNVRIDDFTVISGRVTLHSYIHISHHCGLYGGNAGIEIDDFASISAKCNIYAQSDDYLGRSMTNPMVPAKYKPTAISGAVRLMRHSIIGVSSVILPGVTLGEGAAAGSMSLITRNLEPWSFNFGQPAKKIIDRSRDILALEAQFEIDGMNSR